MNAFRIQETRHAEELALSATPILTDNRGGAANEWEHYPQERGKQERLR